MARKTETDRDDTTKCTFQGLVPDDHPSYAEAATTIVIGGPRGRRDHAPRAKKKSDPADEG